MQQQAKDFYKLIFEFNMELQELLPDIKAKVSAPDQTLVESVDYLFAIDQSFKMLEEVLKHLRGLHETSEKVVCLKYMLQASGNNIKTSYVTATPKMSEVPRIPARVREPEAYSKLMEYFGVNTQDLPLHLGDYGVLRPHWPSLMKYIAGLAEQGEPLPPGCDPKTTYPVYSVGLRKKKGVLED